jgi:hypothetical protein
MSFDVKTTGKEIAISDKNMPPSEIIKKIHVNRHSIVKYIQFEGITFRSCLFKLTVWMGCVDSAESQTCSTPARPSRTNMGKV